MVRIIRWFVCSMLLAGCSSAIITPPGTPSATPAALATPSPAAKPQLTNSQLAGKYLSAVQPINEFTCRFTKRHGTATDMDTWMTFAVMHVGQIHAFADRLHTIEWNRKTRGEARGLIEALAAQEEGYRYAATKRYPEFFWKALDATDGLDANVTEAANALRVALGIKSVPPCI
jgi:hypothetical protein